MNYVCSDDGAGSIIDMMSCSCVCVHPYRKYISYDNTVHIHALNISAWAIYGICCINLKNARSTYAACL